MSLGETLRASAERLPSKVAVTCGDESLTYAELDAQATQLAHGLLSQGIRHGDRVALHMGNTIEMALSYFACFKLGAIAVPVSIRLKTAEIEYVLEHSQAQLYIGEPGLFDRTEATPGCCPSDRFFVTSENDAATGYRTFRQLQVVADGSLPGVSESDVAAILYTSGTTARPKGVTHSHHSLRQCGKVTISMGYRDDDVLLVFSPLTHASGLLCLLVPGVMLGAEMALVARFVPRTVLETIERRRATATLALPATLQALVRELADSTFDVCSLRLCLAGGDAVSLSLQNDFRDQFGVVIQEGIGMTEAVPTSMNFPGRVRRGSVGEAGENVEIRIVAEDGSEAPNGKVGEMIVRHPGTMIGYWDNPEATAETLRDGWLYTGDLAYRDEDGYFWFSGRQKEVIIRGGSNISPQEVEDALLQHPAVYQAGVVGTPDPELGEGVVAFISLHDGSECTERELLAFAAESLSDHKVPGAIHFLEEMPLGITGKVSRKALKATLEKQADAT
jgi:long-chain acyl-CoA synthetase